MRAVSDPREPLADEFREQLTAKSAGAAYADPIVPVTSGTVFQDRKRKYRDILLGVAYFANVAKGISAS